MSDMRGLVVSAPMEVHGSQVMLKSSALDAQEVRSNLLFWDKLDFPTQNAFHIELDPDAQFLESAGVLQRTKTNWEGEYLGDIMRSAHIGAFKFLEAREPGQWSLSTGENSISFPDEDLEEGRGVLVKLYNAIPVPNQDVALADILDYRSKRRAELLALRHHLEEVYQRVIQAGDGPLAWNTEVGKLQKSINDHIKSASEAPFKFRLSDITASLNLLPAGGAALAAYGMRLPLVPAIIQGAVAGIAINAGAALKKREAVSTPFKYVSSYHKEVF